MKKIVLTLLISLLWVYPLWAAGCDTNTFFLTHFNGADTATSADDENCDASGAHTLTFVSDAQLDTDILKFGSATLLLDGTDDVVTLADSADWDWGSSNFTVDFWFYTNIATAQTATCRECSGAGLCPMQLNVDDSSIFTGFTFTGASTCFDASFSSAVSNTVSLSTATWYHYAFVRNGTTGTLYIGGTAQANTVNFGANSIIDAGGVFPMGSKANGTSNLNGNLDEWRMSLVARWTSNFTPPTAEYSVRRIMLTKRGNRAFEDDPIIKVNFVKRKNDNEYERAGWTQNFCWEGFCRKVEG